MLWMLPYRILPAYPSTNFFYNCFVTWNSFYKLQFLFSFFSVFCISLFQYSVFPCFRFLLITVTMEKKLMCGVWGYVRTFAYVCMYLLYCMCVSVSWSSRNTVFSFISTFHSSFLTLLLSIFHSIFLFCFNYFFCFNNIVLNEYCTLFQMFFSLKSFFNLLP